MLRLVEFAQRLGISPDTVNRRRQQGRFLAVSGESRGFRYPVWQLDEQGRLLDGLAEIITKCGNGWPAFTALIRRYDELGCTGAEALRQHRLQDLLRMIDSFGEAFG